MYKTKTAITRKKGETKDRRGRISGPKRNLPEIKVEQCARLTDGEEDEITRNEYHNTVCVGRENLKYNA